MTDPTSPEPHDRDERLGAWLDGGLTEHEAEAVAADIDADPELAARLEALREVRERLAGSTTTDVPDGFTARVQQAVAHEADDAAAPAGREAGGPAAGGQEAGPTPAEPDVAAPRAETVSLAAARQRRQRRWVAVGSVAAAVVAVAVLAPLVGDLAPTTEDAAQTDLAGETEEDSQFDDAGSAGSDDAAPEALEQEAADDTAGGDTAGGDEEAGTQSADSRDERLRATSAGPVPRVVDEQRVFHSSGALRDHAADRPEAVELLDTPPRRADELAERTVDALRDAEPFDDGTHPAACLARVSGQSDGPAVIARVERLILDGEALTAHLVVSAAPNTALDTVTLQVRDPDADCATRLTRRLR